MAGLPTDEACRALETMLVAAVRFANWAAGEGISPSVEGAPEPEEFLFAYSCATGDEEWETLADRLPKILAAHRTQDQNRGGEDVD